jgi:glucoamylase
LGQGIAGEIFYPRVDHAAVRDMGLIVTDAADFFSEEKRDAEHKVEWLEDGVPAYLLTNTCRDGRYRIEKRVVTDPLRDSFLQKVKFTALKGELSAYHLYVLLAPHLRNQGADNTAWVGESEGRQFLFAQRGGLVLALACSAPWLKRSAGYVGSSDGWQDLKAHRQLTHEYARADKGNVALTAEIDFSKSTDGFVLALGFGKDPVEAGRNAAASLGTGFEKIWDDYSGAWRTWIGTQAPSPRGKARAGDLTKKSLAVIRTHESKASPGALIASLAIPWGFSRGDGDQGGYHLVWPRDMVETAGALLAAGVHEDARQVLSYLRATQRPDGHWSQNMWLDGSPYWDGVQMDETAFPILLLDLAHREKAVPDLALTQFWPMVKNAAGYLARNGPVSPQDRWEEDPGYSPFTVGAEIAALLAAADMADVNREAPLGAYFRETADVWNACIERWMFVSGTDWCAKYRVAGYYVRLGPTGAGTGITGPERRIHLKNVADGDRPAAHLVSTDALALVRFGLRAADDPRMLDTVTLIDALLKVSTPSGPAWHRYNGDGYGEHEDGAPFDGTGVGRAWPLLSGERAHYELAAGRTKDAESLLAAMEAFSNGGGLLPEQIWDSQDIASRDLHLGRPSGSAMPLVWAHAEYLKLQRSLRDGRIFDQPRQTVDRYLTRKTESPRLAWRYNHKIRRLPAGKMLRIEVLEPATIRWSADDWATYQDQATRDVGLGIHIADLETQAAPEGRRVKFTFLWTGPGTWEGEDFDVLIGGGMVGRESRKKELGR